MSLGSKEWRLNNLYRIVDRNGNDIPFRLNAVQKLVFDSPHKRKLLLKARQLGMSTYAVLDYMDDCLFTDNLSAGIVSYSLEHAQHIFKKVIGHALDRLKEPYKSLAGIVNRSAREITFNNGSCLRVDTTLRGGAYQKVLVSEFGKICARNPIKAEEIITGTLNTVSPYGDIVIESTGEGNEGYFAEMCTAAHLRGDSNLNQLDYKLFFFPWYLEKSFVLDQKVGYEIELEDYFAKIQLDSGTILTHHQKNWYASQRQLLGNKVKQEFPSTVSEAFLSSSDAYYFSEHIEKAYSDNRCVNTSIYDALSPLYVAMDIGVNDLTVMVFFQICHGEIRVVDYYEDKNKGVDFYARFLLQDKKYLYHTIFLPHDSTKRDPLDTSNTYERDFRKLFSQTGTKFNVLPKVDKNLSISHAKIKFDRCVFNLNKVKPFLDHLTKYRKKWSEQYGRYLDEPYHDIHSNYADCFRYMSQAVSHIEIVSNMSGALEKHRKVVENRSRLI